MRYNQIDPCECTNGQNWGISLFTQGCYFRCKNCFNPETWDPKGGKKFTKEVKQQFLDLLKPKYISRCTILGGEPLIDENLFELSSLIHQIKMTRPDIKIWIYSGYTYEELVQRAQEISIQYLNFILDNIDVLVDGVFIQEQKDITLPFCGSKNQRIIDMPRTRIDNFVVLLDI